MPLIPDLSNVIFSEQNVDIPAGLRTADAYDLTLYRELGNPARAVLVVTIILNFKFIDGTSSNGSGAKLVWTSDGTKSFMDGVKKECTAVWSEEFRLTTLNPTPAQKDVGVIFDIRTAENMGVTSHSHWNVNTTALDSFIRSSVCGCGGNFITNGTATWDSLDLQPVSRGGPNPMRDAIHEFGHMLGLRDEYPGAYMENTVWNGDMLSVMRAGETIQPRHYVFFSDWISRQWQKSPFNCPPNSWKVNGSIDLTNAQI
jgi:hypothetical protein